MWIGWLEFDVLLGDVHSLKQKRSVVRPLVAELQRRFAVSAAETGSHELHRRAGVGIAAVSADWLTACCAASPASPFQVPNTDRLRRVSAV
jgi:uncharacterized protein YlxP (DUF503 family)